MIGPGSTEPVTGRARSPAGERPRGPTGKRPRGPTNERPRGPTGERPRGPTGEPVLRLRNLSVGYDERVVVHEVNLSVHDGEAVAVLGANGSGKTTLVRGLLGLATVIGGDVELGGRPIRTRKDRAQIGYVPQRHTIAGAIPSTVREVVSSGRLPLLAWHGRLADPDRAAVQRAIDTVSLGPLADTELAVLSGGQQRRALIARALAAEPRVLIMDEPTAGVDQASQQALAVAMRRLADHGTPMVVITHEVAAMADVLTRAVTIEAGRIVSDRAVPPRDRPRPIRSPGGPVPGGPVPGGQR
jgi:zinc transport system ATP-binding protein